MPPPKSIYVSELKRCNKELTNYLKQWFSNFFFSGISEAPVKTDVKKLVKNIFIRYFFISSW